MLIKLIERSLVYPRPSRERGDWRPKWLQPQNVWFRSADNTKLHGWYVPNPEAKRLIVYAHPDRKIGKEGEQGSMAKRWLRRTEKKC